MPELEPDLPFPFDKVVGWFGNLIIETIKLMINLVADRMCFRIIPGLVELPGQDTQIKLSNFDGFYFERSPVALGNNPLGSKLRFLAYAVDVEPVKAQT
jgi:hypothetical protein